MYSITQSPGFAIDLAHAVMDEQLRRAAGTRRTPKQPAPRAGSRVRPWRPSSWHRHPAPAI